MAPIDLKQNKELRRSIVSRLGKRNLKLASPYGEKHGPHEVDFLQEVYIIDVHIKGHPNEYFTVLITPGAVYEIPDATEWDRADKIPIGAKWVQKSKEFVPFWVLNTKDYKKMGYKILAE